MGSPSQLQRRSVGPVGENQGDPSIQIAPGLSFQNRLQVATSTRDEDGQGYGPGPCRQNGSFTVAGAGYGCQKGSCPAAAGICGRHLHEPASHRTPSPFTTRPTW